MSDMNHHQRRVHSAKLRKSGGIKINPFAPDGMELVIKGAKTCSNRSRPHGVRSRRGAN